MTRDEFEAWTAHTKSGASRWISDDITRLNGRGALLYIGGEDGVYIRVSPNGELEAGGYEGAIPHIGEAFFTVRLEEKHAGFSEAFEAAKEIGGVKLLVDLKRSGVPSEDTEPALDTAYGERIGFLRMG